MGRAPPAQGLKQPGRELAPADSATRARAPALQITGARAAVPRAVRPDLRPLPPPPAPPPRPRVPPPAADPLRDLACGHGASGRCRSTGGPIYHAPAGHPLLP